MQTLLKFKKMDGSTITASKVIGRGGEGVVYALDGIPNIAAKIYGSSISSSRRDKIFSMAGKQWHKGNSLVAFPIEPLLTERGDFAGFLMSLVMGYRPIHELYSPADRKKYFPSASYPFLVRAATNIARAFSNIHSLGCVIGDVNHSGILVSKDATVVIIDSDSFQFTDGTSTYLCRVGVPEFTPPELQNSDLSKVIRTANHDNFGLSTLIFHLLMMGRHPYDGVFRGKGEMDRVRAISERRFAYSSNTNRTSMSPPPNAPILSDLPKPLSEAFERAFMEAVRPTASEWVALLDAAERKLVKCGSKPQHHHFGGVHECRWCAIERAFPGYELFPAAPVFTPASNDNDVLKLKNEFNLIVLSSSFDPMSMLVNPNVVPSSIRTEVLSEARKRHVAATAAMAIGILILFAAPLFWIAAAISGAVGLYLANKTGAAYERLRQRLRDTEGEWNTELKDYRAKTDGSDVFRLKSEIGDRLRQIDDLPNLENKLMAELKSRQREIQLRQHLENHHIQNGSISKISPQLKQTLRSFGIETAFDVSHHRVINIPGFGPVRTDSVVAWRKSVENRFVFDPNKALNPSDVTSIKNTVSVKRNALLQEANTRLAACKVKFAEVKTSRSLMPADVQRAFSAYQQSKTDTDGLSVNYFEFLRQSVWGLIASVAILFAVVIAANVSNKAPRVAATTTPPIVTPTAPEQPSTRSTSGTATTATINSPREAVPTKSPSVPPLVAPSVGGSFQSPTIATPSPSSPPTTSGNLKPLPPIITIESAPKVHEADDKTLRSLKVRADATEIQRKLFDLGYYTDAIDGLWGAKARAALRKYKRNNNLGDDEVWNLQTEIVLFREGSH